MNLFVFDVLYMPPNVIMRKEPVLAGTSVIGSTRCIDDPQYIAIPVVLHKDIFIYYSFGGEPLRLYRLKKDRATKCFRVHPSTGCRKFDIKNLLLNWDANLRVFSRK